MENQNIKTLLDCKIKKAKEEMDKTDYTRGYIDALIIMGVELGFYPDQDEPIAPTQLKEENQGLRCDIWEGIYEERGCHRPENHPSELCFNTLQIKEDVCKEARER
jgi:hypothetical protein